MSDLIPDAHLSWEIVDPDGPGGQKGLVRHDLHCLHVPTGIRVVVPGRVSQHRQRAVCRQMIEAALTSPEWRP